MKILITGGSGFIGTNVVEYFLNINYDVLNLDVNKPKNVIHLPFWKKTDILDKIDLHQKITSFAPEFLIHLAARTDLNGISEKDYEANTIGTLNLIDVLKETKSVKRVIFTSSMLVCKLGHIPKDENEYSATTIYGQSKVAMEKLIRNTNHQYTYAIVRPTSIWGPWFGTPYKDFFDMILNNTYFNIGGNKVQKTYGFIGNVTQQIADILLANDDKQMYYLGDAPPIKINEWANQISYIIREKKVKTLPMRFVKLLSFFGDFLGLLKIKFPMTSFRYKNMTTDNIVNVENTLKLSPTRFTNQKENIITTINWIKNDSKK